MSTLLDTLLSNTYTVADAHRRLNVVQECLEDFFYHSDNNQNISLRSAVVAYAQEHAQQHDVTALTQWDEGIWNECTAQSFNDMLRSTEEALEQLPTMTLYVPVVLNEEGLQMLGVWCRDNIQQTILLSVLIDPHTTGGCAFVHNDVYHDFSLRHFFEDKRGVVSNILRSYE